MKQKLDILEIIGLARLHELFSYYPNSGQLIWKIDLGGMAKAGVVAGNLKRTGYRQIKVDGKNLYAHRIAFYMFHGRLPVGGQVDHLNGSKADNRVENLWEVTNREKGKNKKKPKNNASGVVGVSWAARAAQWVAKIQVDGNYKHLGYFDDFDEAVKARKAAEKDLGFHHNHGKR